MTHFVKKKLMHFVQASFKFDGSMSRMFLTRN